MNNKLLCFYILYKESEALPPFWVFICVHNLKKEKKGGF